MKRKYWRVVDEREDNWRQAALAGHQWCADQLRDALRWSQYSFVVKQWQQLNVVQTVKVDGIDDMVGMDP